MDENNKSVQEVFEKTHALAHALLDSDVYQAMKTAEEQAMVDPDAGKAMTEYLEHKSAVEELLAQDGYYAEIYRISRQNEEVEIHG